MRSEDYTKKIREKHSKVQTKLWQDPEYRKMQTASHNKKRGLQVEHVDKVCLYCGNIFTVAPWESSRKFCVRACYNSYNLIHRVGSKAPNWRGGISKVGHFPYPIDFDNRIRKLVRERDNYTCQLCGIIEDLSLSMFGKQLSIHHIDYDKCNTSQWNLISLCCRCHAKTNYNRSYWSEMFTSFVQQSVSRRKIIDLDYMILRKPKQCLCVKEEKE